MFARPNRRVGASPKRAWFALALYCTVPAVSTTLPLPRRQSRMSAWASLAIRAGLKPGETVRLVKLNGATGSGATTQCSLRSISSQPKLIATGRNEGEREKLKSLGAMTSRYRSHWMPTVWQGAERTQRLIAECRSGHRCRGGLSAGADAQTSCRHCKAVDMDSDPLRGGCGERRAHHRASGQRYVRPPLVDGRESGAFFAAAGGISDSVRSKACLPNFDRDKRLCHSGD